jgi:hypothetical protein
MPEIRPELEPVVMKDLHLGINLEKLFKGRGMHHIYCTDNTVPFLVATTATVYCYIVLC